MVFYPTVEINNKGWGWNQSESIPEKIHNVASSIFQMKRNYQTALRELTYDNLWKRIGEDVSAIGNIRMYGDY